MDTPVQQNIAQGKIPESHVEKVGLFTQDRPVQCLKGKITVQDLSI